MPFLESLFIGGYVWDNRRRQSLVGLTYDLSKITPNGIFNEVTVVCHIFFQQSFSRSAFLAAGWEEFSAVINGLAQTLANVTVNVIVNYLSSRWKGQEKLLHKYVMPLFSEGIVRISGNKPPKNAVEES